MKTTNWLVCPVCRCEAVILHSELKLSIGATSEPTRVYTCGNSHAFMIPCCSLPDARQNHVREQQGRQEAAQQSILQQPSDGDRRTPVLIDQCNQNTFRFTVYESRVAIAQSSHLRMDFRRSRAELRMAKSKFRKLFGELRANLKARAITLSASYQSPHAASNCDLMVQ